MQLGMVGLGRMGGNMVRRLMKSGHQCVVYDRNPAPGKELAGEGATSVNDLAELVRHLNKPRAVWVMVPAGKPTEESILALSAVLEAGDIIVDGGNSYFKDDVRHAELLKAKGIHFVDCGTSGGVWGLERGYCLMIGGEDDIVRHLDPIFRALAPGVGDIERTPGRKNKDGTAELGYLHCGPHGSGHFVKMIHNGIEYGLMQAYAEGMSILRHARDEKVKPEYRYNLELA
ncbi:MAG TPA: NADP-dependent phosphogluconate dehydrogenase, partial [Candidatus Obscuribacterales bacterium]